MRIDFDSIKTQLDEQYRKEQGKIKDYYINEEGQVVATIDREEKIITTYFDDEEDILESHYRKIAVVFAKDITIICDKTPIPIDAMYVDKLLEEDNDAIMPNEYRIKTNYNKELEEKYLDKNENASQHNLGSIGVIKEEQDDILHFIMKTLTISIDKKMIHPQNKEFNVFLLRTKKPLNLSDDVIKAILKQYEKSENRTYTILDEPTIQQQESQPEENPKAKTYCISLKK